MIIDSACDRTSTNNRTRSVARRGVRAFMVAAAVGAGNLVCATQASAEQPSAMPTAQQAPGIAGFVAEAQAGPPMPVPDGAFGFLATHDLTQRMSTMKAAEAIASLPVPEGYRPANLSLASHLDLAVKGALADRRGCVQIIVDPKSTSGALFDYGFYAVSGQYCP